MSTQRTHCCSKLKRHTTGGFTLVELMVSLMVFSIVMTISIGTLLVLVDANAKAQALYSSSTNLSFALDSMTRDIRTGYDYYCGSDGDSFDPGEVNDCPSGDTFIAFTRERDGVRVGYRLNGTALERTLNDGATWIPMTSSDEVSIDTLTFSVTGSTGGAGDSDQPTVGVIMSGSLSNGLEIETDFNIQSHVVQRRLDLY